LSGSRIAAAQIVDDARIGIPDAGHP
jgi:hypothetical protein